MKAKKISNITGTDWLNFYPTGDMTKDQLAKLGKFDRLIFSFEEFYNQKAWEFLKETILLMLPAYDVHLVFSEPRPQKKAAIRSHKKMFFDLRKDIDEGDRYETEVNTGDGESIMAGVIKLKPDKVGFCLGHLIISNLQFAYVVRRSEQNAQINWGALFQQMVKDTVISSKARFIHFPKILADYAGDDRSLITLAYTGNDDQIVEFFVKDENVRHMVEEMEVKYRAEVEN